MKRTKEEIFTTAAGIDLRITTPNRFDLLMVDTGIAGEPTPPTRKTETAFGIEDVPQVDNPAYNRARNLWRVEQSKRTLDFMLLEYVQVDVPDPLPDDLQQTYARLLALGLPVAYDLNTADGRKLAYLRRLLTGAEPSRLQAFIRRLAMPTEAEIQAAEAGFPGAVPGAATNG